MPLSVTISTQEKTFLPSRDKYMLSIAGPGDILAQIHTTIVLLTWISVKRKYNHCVGITWCHTDTTEPSWGPGLRSVGRREGVSIHFWGDVCPCRGLSIVLLYLTIVHAVWTSCIAVCDEEDRGGGQDSTHGLRGSTLWRVSSIQGCRIPVCWLSRYGSPGSLCCVLSTIFKR